MLLSSLRPTGLQQHASTRSRAHNSARCCATDTDRASTATLQPPAPSSQDIIIERSDFRAGVGICVVNKAGLVFSARRIDDPDCWQLPQGGVDEGEQPVATALRELREETAISSVEVVTCMPQWVHYVATTLVKSSTPGVTYRYPGQRQKWYMLRFVGNESEINLDTCHKEFLEWRWLPLQQVAANVVPFKRSVYQQMAAEFGPRIQQLVTKGTVGFGPVSTAKKQRSKRVVPAHVTRLLAQSRSFN